MESNKAETLQLLEAAFDRVSAVSVRGDDTERIADVRALLRQAYANLKQEVDDNGRQNNR